MFDNRKGFKPKGSLLYFWTLLPQVTTTLNQKKIPALFGNIRNIGLYYVLVGILIAAEAYLMISVLPKEGVPFQTLLTLSVIDFIIAIFPLFIELNPHRNKAIIKANIFIAETKLRIPFFIDSKTSTEVGAKEEVEDDLRSYKKQKMLITIIEFIVYLVIVFFAFWKLWSFQRIFGSFSELFFDPTGRLIISVILYSVFVHIGFTKTVLCHMLFYFKMNAQESEFRNHSKTDFDDTDKNSVKKLDFKVNYKPVVVNNQQICQEITKQEEIAKKYEITLKIGQVDKHYKIDQIDDEQNVYLIYSGLLLDTEINKLSQQNNNTIARAVIASCKEVQIQQIIPSK